jgi:hypothetical protein
MRSTLACVRSMASGGSILTAGSQLLVATRDPSRLNDADQSNEPVERLPLPLGLGPGFVLPDACRVGLVSGDVCPVPLSFAFSLGELRRILCPFRSPPPPHGHTA